MRSAEDGRAGVALALCVAPGLVVAGQVELDLALLELGLLDGEDVRARGLHHVGEAGVLLHDGAQAVDVPGNEAQLAGHEVPFDGGRLGPV